MNGLRLGLLQYRVSRVEGVAGFADKLDRKLAEGVRAGAELLVLPEYACMEIGGAASGTPDVRRELDAVTSRAADILNAMREAAIRHRVWLVPGSLPVREGGRTRNRAPLIAPDGRIAFQDKRVMTRFESESWDVQPGDSPAVFETPWGRIGIAICYDVEFPTLVRAQVEEGAWLILAPSCTDTMWGFNRVRLAARARALENQCYVAVAPTVGDAPWSATLDANRGYAAVYGPVDRGFPEDGLLARGALDAEQWLFADLDPARLAAVRADGGVRNYLDWPRDTPRARLTAPA
jgi:predicted amidohydrolase